MQLSKIKRAYQAGGLSDIFARVLRRIHRRWKVATFKPYVIEKTIGEQRFPIFITDIYGQKLYDHSRPWPEVEWLVANAIKRGDVVVDCGANQGVTTILFSKAVGTSGKVIAIEPLPWNVEAIRKSKELSSASNVIVIESAAGSVRSSAKMHTHSVAGNIADDGTFQVAVMPLDDLVPGNVDFLKIDVEGHEIEVLKGAKRILSNRPRLDIEIHCLSYSDRPAMVSEILRLVNLDQYRVFVQMEVDGPIVEYDANLHSVNKIAAQTNVHLFCV